MSYTLQPLGSRLIVRLRPQVQKGLIVRVQNDDAARPADVISVGPEVRDFEPGQGVLVSALAGQQVGDDVLLPESSILAYLDD
jgi:hypothetical protein